MIISVRKRFTVMKLTYLRGWALFAIFVCYDESDKGIMPSSVLSATMCEKQGRTANFASTAMVRKSESAGAYHKPATRDV
jgi:hypothetical protein